MSTTQSKLAAYVGIERPAILEALGLPTDDQIGLDQLWEQFAQLAATGTVGVGKTLFLVDELPETGDENTYYGLKEQIVSDKGPVEDPQAGIGFNAIFNINPDLSSAVLGGTGTGTMVSSVMQGVTADLVFSALAASSVFENVTAGANSTVVQMVQTIDSNYVATIAFICVPYRVNRCAPNHAWI